MLDTLIKLLGLPYDVLKGLLKVYRAFLHSIDLDRNNDVKRLETHSLQTRNGIYRAILKNITTFQEYSITNYQY